MAGPGPGHPGTQLSSPDELRFQAWAHQNGITDVDAPDSYYDYRGFWRETKGASHEQGTHFPDTYKLPGHPTFSVESKYYVPGVTPAGSWDGETFIPPGLDRYSRMFRKVVGRDPNTAEIEHELTRRQQAPYASVAPINQPAAMREPSLHEDPTPAEKWVLNRLSPEYQVMRTAYATPGSTLRHLGEMVNQGVAGVGEFMTAPLSLMRARLRQVDRDTHQGRVDAAQHMGAAEPTPGQVLAGLNPVTQARDFVTLFGQDPAGALAMLTGMEVTGGALGFAKERAPVEAPPVDWSRVHTPQLEHSGAAPGIIDARASEIGRRLLDHVSEPAEATYQRTIDRRAQRLLPPGYEPRRGADLYLPTERAQIAARIAQNIEGATLVPQGKMPTTEAGFAVADPSLTRRINPTENLNAAIQRWITRMEVQRALREPGAHVGTWRDPETGQAEVNVTGLMPDEAQARMLGGARGEKAIGELGPGGEYLRSIQLPGSSVVPYEPRSTALVPTRPPEPPTPSNIIAAGLSKDDAVAQMKRLSAAGERAQMRSQPDGLYSLVRKGAPQPMKIGETLMKPAAVPTPPIGRFGTATDAGFQSRLLTAVQEGKWPDKGMTPVEWYKRLKNMPGVPQAELDEVMESQLPPPKNTFRVLDAKGKEIDRLTYASSSVLSADEVKRGLVQHDGYDPSIEVRGATDEPQRMTAQQMYDHIEANSPIQKLGRETLSGEGGHEITEYDIQQEAEFLRENEAEYHHDEAARLIGERDKELTKLRTLLRRAYGRVGGDEVYGRIASNLVPEGDLEDWYKDYDGAALRDVLPDLATLRQDPAQLRLSGVRREPSEAFHNKLRYQVKLVEDRQTDAAIEMKDAENPDWDWLNEQARERLQEDHEGYNENPHGNTEYPKYQRVDKEASYREVLVTNPDLNDEYHGHFEGVDNVQTHARGEIHGTTYLMIEAQSDLGQKGRGPSFFHPTERWVQLSTGASLVQAAEEGLDYFAWVTPEDRVRRANLHETAAQNTYGIAVPKAVERIFKWLDEPIKVERWHSNGGTTYPRVKLTQEMRAKILRAGVPALGIAAISLGASSSEDARRDRLARKIRGK